MVEQEVRRYCEREGVEFSKQLRRRIRRKFEVLRRAEGLKPTMKYLEQINVAR